MDILSLRHASVLVLLLAFWPTGTAFAAGQVLEKDGVLVVMVTYGDVDNTPARNVVVEVYGYGRKYPREKSVLLKPSKGGQYGASLQPGIYDVFVSEGSSTPRCRRLEIRAGQTSYWTLKLEIDDVYLDKSRAAP
jgi:hypothetical protein